MDHAMTKNRIRTADRSFSATHRPLTMSLLIGAAMASAAAFVACSNGDDGPLPVEVTLVEPVLAQEESIYEELVEEMRAMGALDANGHMNQLTLAQWAQQQGGLSDEQQRFLFDMGDEMTEFQYTVSDGVGSLLGVGDMPISRFNRAPNGGRFTGPNARGCGDCHDAPQGNAAGDNVNNVLQDPDPAVAGPFNLRNTRNINGDAWLELAAIEMTIELQAQLADCKSRAAAGAAQTVQLTTKGVRFGSLTCAQNEGRVGVDYSRVEGVSLDLVVRPQGWKGNVPSFRTFSEDAAFGEMGMMSDRFAYVVAGDALPTADLGSINVPDVDGDLVSHEMSVGDMTAIQFYFAAQSHPTTLLQLARERPSLLTRAVTDGERALISEGAQAFGEVGCTGCHYGMLPVNDPVFRIPDERVAAFRDVELEASSSGYSSTAQIRLDLSSNEVVEEPRIEATSEGIYEVRALTDLKRHYMGEHLCDGAKESTPIDSSFRPVTVPTDSISQALPVKIGRCEFLTADLWGIAQTAPYMHDGRAGTLREAIQEHCSTGTNTGAGNASCLSFNVATPRQQEALVAFLMNQVFRPDDPVPSEE
jgi:hypothetical protein